MYVAFGIKKYTLSIQVPDNARQGINATEQNTKSMTRYFIIDLKRKAFA
jgi:translation elongation factor EF-1beta